MLFCLASSSASVVSLLILVFLIWYLFSSLASLSSSFFEFSEGWETVSKFQLEIFLFRCLLSWWCWSVCQDLYCFCLCVSLAWVSLLQVIAGGQTQHLPLSYNPHILQPSSEPSCNADVVSLVFCSIVWGSIQPGDEACVGRRFHQWLISCCWHIDFTYISHFHSLCQCHWEWLC